MKNITKQNLLISILKKAAQRERIQVVTLYLIYFNARRITTAYMGGYTSFITLGKQNRSSIKLRRGICYFLQDKNNERKVQPLMKNKLLLLSGTGISRLGDFMYLIALNVMVLHSTNSPAAVAGLWIVGPIATVFTKIWSGSIVDRLNKRSIMLITDIIRAALIGCIPLFDSIWAIYILSFDSHCYIIFRSGFIFL